MLYNGASRPVFRLVEEESMGTTHGKTSTERARPASWKHAPPPVVAPGRPQLEGAARPAAPPVRETPDDELAARSNQKCHKTERVAMGRCLEPWMSEPPPADRR